MEWVDKVALVDIQDFFWKYRLKNRVFKIKYINKIFKIQRITKIFFLLYLFSFPILFVLVMDFWVCFVFFQLYFLLSWQNRNLNQSNIIIYSHYKILSVDFSGVSIYFILHFYECCKLSCFKLAFLRTHVILCVFLNCLPTFQITSLQTCCLKYLFFNVTMIKLMMTFKK